MRLPDGRPGRIDDVIRIDLIPSINRFASAHALSNPDFLLDLSADEGHIVVACDAKFSIETGRAKQVSAEVLRALIETDGSPVAAVLPSSRTLADGLFLTPDIALTHAILAGRSGLGRLTLKPAQIELVPARTVDLITDVHLVAGIEAFAALDGYAEAWRDDLGFGLYGLRCTAAATGCWLDATRPMLPMNDETLPDMPAVISEIQQRAHRARTGWSLIQRWDEEVEVVRAQRVAISRLTTPPMAARDLRPMIDQIAQRRGVTPPSMSSVRRQLAAATRAHLRGRFGPLEPPITDLDAITRAINREMGGIVSRLEATLEEIVAQNARRSEGA